MSPSTTRTGSDTARTTTPETTRFRCGCGRSVATRVGSEAATSGRCSTCRSRRTAEAPLHRT